MPKYYSLEEIISIFKDYSINKTKIENFDFSHIKYNKSLDADNVLPIYGCNPKKYCDIRMIRSSIHDGTLIFTYEMILDILTKLGLKKCWHSEINDKYPIGYEIVKLMIDQESCEKSDNQCFDGFREIICLPVKFTYEEKL